MFNIYNGDTGGQVGNSSVTIAGFDKPIKLVIQGSGEAYAVCENALISKDELLWDNRVSLEFETMFQPIYVKPSNNIEQEITIKIEQA